MTYDDDLGSAGRLPYAPVELQVNRVPLKRLCNPITTCPSGMHSPRILLAVIGCLQQERPLSCLSLVKTCVVRSTLAVAIVTNRADHSDFCETPPDRYVLAAGHRVHVPSNRVMHLPVLIIS